MHQKRTMQVCACVRVCAHLRRPVCATMYCMHACKIILSIMNIYIYILWYVCLLHLHMYVCKWDHNGPYNVGLTSSQKIPPLRLVLRLLLQIWHVNRHATTPACLWNMGTPQQLPGGSSDHFCIINSWMPWWYDIGCWWMWFKSSWSCPAKWDCKSRAHNIGP